MSVPLSPASTRRLAASRFGAEFRKAMEQRGVGIKAVERASGISHTNLWSFKFGRNLPRLETALRMAEALEWPRLGELIREARSDVCHRDGCSVAFLNEGGSPKRYCSQDCQRLAAQIRNETQNPGAAQLALEVQAELDRVHGSGRSVRRKVLARAVANYNSSGSKRGRRVDSVQDKLDTAKAAAAAFCRSCEPDGLCQTPSCELRPISPLPLVGEQRDTRLAVKAPGAWGNPANRESQLRALRAAAERRWTPEERLRMAALSRRRWEAMTPEQRSEMGHRIRTGKRKEEKTA